MYRLILLVLILSNVVFAGDPGKFTVPEYEGCENSFVHFSWYMVAGANQVESYHIEILQDGETIVDRMFWYYGPALDVGGVPIYNTKYETIVFNASLKFPFTAYVNGEGMEYAYENCTSFQHYDQARDFNARLREIAERIYR